MNDINRGPRDTEEIIDQLISAYDSLREITLAVSKFVDFESIFLMIAIYDFILFLFYWCSEFGVAIISLIINCIFHLILNFYRGLKELADDEPV